VHDYETAALRELSRVVAEQGLRAGYSFADQRPHPKMWASLAEASLEALDLGMADKAFVRAKDYKGVAFVKRLNGLTDKMKQRAEIAAHFGRHKEGCQFTPQSHW